MVSLSRASVSAKLIARIKEKSWILRQTKRVKPNRLEAFSDGVFAVAITLLIFNLKVPDIGNGHLGSALSRNWPSYAAFLVSFLSIGICWVNHHSIFDRVAMVDRELLYVNLALLLGIVLIPYSTSLAASWYREGSDSKWAVAIYCAIWVYTCVMYVTILRHLMGHEHLSANVNRANLKVSLRKSYVGVAVYMAATLLSFVFPIVAFLFCLIFITYYVVIR